MKNILVLLAVLSAASLSFAGDAKSCADKAKCTEKSDKGCCCCCCKGAKDSKMGCTDKAAPTKDAAKPATTAERK